jgi:hypothetical protein
MLRQAALVSVIAGTSLALGCQAKPTGRARHERLYRSVRAIEAATNLGTSLVRLGELVHLAAAEALISGDMAQTPDEKAMVKMYADAVDAYNDSLKLWAVQIEYSSHDAFKGYIPIQPGSPVETVAKTYKLDIAVRRTPTGYTYPGVPEEGAVQAVWKAAAQRAEAARQVYLAENQ